jgi:peptidoglycan hydrolase-like protein with peptidoglycan-binding domain
MIKLKSLLQEQTTLFKQGMRDPKVGTKEGPIAKIQQKLIDAGIMNPIPEASYGHYGPKTAAAVVEFQKKQFPDEPDAWDGKVGKNTTAALNKISSTSNNNFKFDYTIVKTPDTRLDRTYFQKTAEKTAGTFEKTAGPLLFKFVDKFMGKDVIGPKFVQQYLLPKNLTDEDFNDFDRKTIGGVIADAIKQGQPVNKGAVSYKAYNNKIAQLLDTKFDPIAFTTALFTIQGWPQKLLNRLRFAFLFGQFNYKLDQKTKTYTIVEDPYDFSKSGSHISMTNFTTKYDIIII